MMLPSVFWLRNLIQRCCLLLAPLVVQQNHESYKDVPCIMSQREDEEITRHKVYLQQGLPSRKKGGLEDNIILIFKPQVFLFAVYHIIWYQLPHLHLLCHINWYDSSTLANYQWLSARSCVSSNLWQNLLLFMYVYEWNASGLCCEARVLLSVMEWGYVMLNCECTYLSNMHDHQYTRQLIYHIKWYDSGNTSYQHILEKVDSMPWSRNLTPSFETNLNTTITHRSQVLALELGLMT